MLSSGLRKSGRQGQHLPTFSDRHNFDKVRTYGSKGITRTMQTADMKTLSERADELEEQMIKTLDKVPVKSPLYTMGEVDPRVG